MQFLNKENVQYLHSDVVSGVAFVCKFLPRVTWTKHILVHILMCIAVLVVIMCVCVCMCSSQTI